MRRSCTAMAGVALLVLAAAFAGCSSGDSGTAAPGSGFITDTNTTEFKSTDTKQFKDMMGQMQDNMKKNNYTQKPAPAKEKAAEKAK